MNSKKVFVVHGRNEKIRKSMFSFLRSIGLEPLEWSQIVDSLGQSNPYIGEVLDHGFSISQATVILMTPDDEAKLKNEFVKASDPSFESELTPQPRQNVLLEAGMSLGKFPEKTIIVQIGTMRQISDLLGRHVIRLNDSSEQRHELSQRLKKCKCDVDTSGKDWFTEGNFNLDDTLTPKLQETIDLKPPKIVDSVKKSDVNHSGPSGGVQLLIENRFFDEPKLLGDIFDGLKENGYHYPRSTINAVLMRVFIKGRKTITRLKENGSWKYVLKK